MVSMIKQRKCVRITCLAKVFLVVIFSDTTRTLGAATDEIKFKYIAQGAQGAIYRCQAENEAIVPNDTALKVYFDGELDLEKLEKIDTQLTEQNLRYPVYDWIKGAKFEEFLSGRRDLDPEDFARADIREAVARQFARLHGGGLI